jgi:hypothetical protein
MFTLLLSSNGCICSLNDSGFEPLHHNIKLPYLRFSLVYSSYLLGPKETPWGFHRFFFSLYGEVCWRETCDRSW